MNTQITTSAKKAASFIKEGRLVGFPTETVYGLGADAFNEEAVKQIFRVKNRPADNPLIVHISSVDQINLLASEVPDSALKIVEKFFPGPVTIVLKKHEVISGYVTAGTDTIAVRMPSLELTRKFIFECGVPVAAPSANISGSPSPTSWKHVYEDLNGKIACILKGGRSKVGIESTVVDCTAGVPVILRPGSISSEDLQQLFPGKEIVVHTDPSVIKSPGVKYKHYSPSARVCMVESPDEMESIARFAKTDKIAFIGTRHVKGMDRQRTVSSPEDYAHQLFSFFRSCDESDIKIIFCERVEEIGIGLALMNRIRKASSDENDLNSSLTDN